MRTEKVSIEQWLEIANSIKLTTPQQKVVDLVSKGNRLKIVNAHHCSGGEIVWVNTSGNDMGAGHIYKAYQYLHYAMKRKVGYDVICDALWVK